MGSNNLQDFIDEFNGGNRSHRYDVEMDWPTAAQGVNTSGVDLNKFFVRSVALPASQINPIRIPYRGRVLKYPGDRIFYPWTFRVLDQNVGNGANKSIWNNFNAWSNYINNYTDNIHNDSWDAFTADWTIQQTDAEGDVIKTATIYGCWPTVVGPITLDSNAIDTLVEFTVTVEYQWAEID
jgi:hypothetical protein